MRTNLTLWDRCPSEPGAVQLAAQSPAFACSVLEFDVYAATGVGTYWLSLEGAAAGDEGAFELALACLGAPTLEPSPEPSLGPSWGPTRAPTLLPTFTPSPAPSSRQRSRPSSAPPSRSAGCGRGCATERSTARSLSGVRTRRLARAIIGSCDTSRYLPKSRGTVLGAQARAPYREPR